MVTAVVCFSETRWYTKHFGNCDWWRSIWMDQSCLSEDVIPLSALAPLLSSMRRTNIKNYSNSEKAFKWRSVGYEHIVTQRATIFSNLLEKTNNDVVYADTDIRWLKNPQKLLRDSYCTQRESSDEIGYYNCSGFMFFRNTTNTPFCESLGRIYQTPSDAKRIFYWSRGNQ